MKLGIVGLPNTGKSTIFNALTKAGAVTANYAFSTIEPNVGVIAVPDTRLDFLTELEKSVKTVPTSIEFVDMAGLVSGSSKGEGLGNKFLSYIREVDAIVHVVRCFDDGNVEGAVNPMNDIETINFELIFADIEILERRIEKTKKLLKADKGQAELLALYERVNKLLEDGVSARAFDLYPNEWDMLADMQFLSSKPVIYALNISETDAVEDAYLAQPYYSEAKSHADTEKSPLIVLCASLEAELSVLSEEEKAEFLVELGLNESRLDLFITESYKLLGLISFFTAGPKETRAWTVTLGTKAPRAAGKIHSDIERGFIRAEIVAFKHLEDAGSMVVARERGQVRLEGKEYVMNDGDVVLFRFNV